ncbi:AI-2E family transporter [Curtobacterium aetherium]|uniref:AI-2E family transporter n=1 Tax=Curtobacterium aetherium TaxID=2841594 RepID=A0ACD1E6W0_9MICO|nr:AI-2E family transporter [Curtobacterium sp. L6-1]QWS34722.1 AI-2E family transporter [Curtobacterium sp. L6-1]
MPFFRPGSSSSSTTTPDTEPSRRSPWSDGFGRLAVRCFQVIGVAVILAGVVSALGQVGVVTIPVLLALIIASAMHPLAGWLRRHGVPSVLATIICFVSVLAVLGAIGWLLVTAVSQQLPALRESAVDGLQQLQDLARHLPVTITDQQIDDAVDTVVGFVTSARFGSSALAGISAVTSFVTGAVLTAVILFFFVKDGPALWEFLLRPFTGASYDRARRIGDRVVSTLGGYVRGTAAVAAFDGVAIGTGLVLLGVPLAVPLAVVAFVTSFIPMIGAPIAGTLAALVTLVALGPWQAVVVVVIVVVVNQIEGNFLQPVLMGRTLQLHGLVILVALTAGTVVAGIIGAIVAVPLVAAVWGVVQVWDGEDRPARPWRQKRRETVTVGSD